MIRSSRRNWIVGGVAMVVAIAAAGIYVVVDGGLFADCDDVGADPVAADSYDLTKLDEGDETAQALSPSGEYVVSIDWESDAPGEEQALLRNDGSVVDDHIGGGELNGIVDVFGVNDSGDVVGGFEDVETSGWAVVDGETWKLRGPDGSVNVEPKAIAGDGTIVGYFGTSKANRIPAKWAPGAIKATKLDTPDGLHGKAIDISENGTVVGVLYDGDHPGDSKSTYAWMWDANGDGGKLSGEFDFAAEDKPEKSWPVDITCDWVLIDTGPGFVRANLSSGDAEAVKGIGEHWPDDSAVPGIDGHGRAFGTNAVDDDYGPKGIFDEGFTEFPGMESPDVKTKIVGVSQDGCVVLGKEIMLTCK